MSQSATVHPVHRRLWSGLCSDDPAAEVGVLGVPFDNATSYAGEWGVDETMQLLSHEEGLEAIIIALPNMGVERVDEYSPFVMPRLGGGRGYDYMRFLVETVKPLVDATFRTMPEREHTGIMGSSLGGLISLYGYFSHIDTFGFSGVMSPSLWFVPKTK